MTLSRRSAIKLGLGAGALPLLGRPPFVAEAEAAAPGAGAAAVVKARPLPLSAVRLLAGPLKRAQELDARYLLALEPDRMLAYYRDRAGLQPKAEPYGGWDGDGRNLTGHIAGHYLSAVSLMWSATGDPRFKQRADYIVRQLKEVQDAHGDGYLSALKGGQKAFDDLAGTHANTQIPKILGSAARFLYTDTPADLLAAGFFWDRVVQHHSFSSGGHGKDEYFGPADELSDWIDGRTAETCNVYNMLKLTRRLFSFWPDPHYADYHERALFNHMLASIDPADGRVCYMVPVGPAVTHEYQDMFRDFTCDVGTGMENHALHGDGIYYEGDDRLWVNLYVPSSATWAKTGVELTMETDFPEGETAKLALRLRAPREFTLALRRPYWTGQGFLVKLNGQIVEPGQEPAPDSLDRTGRSQYRRPAYEPSSYLELKRRWTSGDVVEVALPKTLHLEPLPDNPHRLSLMWGPLVLAGDLGPEPDGHRGEGARAPAGPT